MGTHRPSACPTVGYPLMASIPRNARRTKKSLALGMKIIREIASLVFLFLFLACCRTADRRAPFLTQLEQSGYDCLTSSTEISRFLTQLAHRNAQAVKITIGWSARGNPIEALLVATEIEKFEAGYGLNDKLTVMLVGSQHGMEPSGAEALLLMARDILEGKLSPHLEDMNFIFIPNSNPDGRDLNRRVNGNGINLSTNYTILSEPESKAVAEALHRWKPEVVLDVHESAVLKKKSLGKQGFLIDFESQFEAANNPNVDWQIRAFSFERLLPEVIAQVNAQGLQAQRYIGEITDIHQEITHGGLSLRNLRNFAGMMGCFAFLLENRLDPSTGTYPTPRNIQVRVAKQYRCICSFLSCCRLHAAEIMDISRDARRRWRDGRGDDSVYLSFAYVRDSDRPQIILPLRKLATGELIDHTFSYRGAVASGLPLLLPASYVVTAHQDLIKEFLDRHQITYETVKESAVAPARIRQIILPQSSIDPGSRGNDAAAISGIIRNHTLKSGDLIISLEQPARKLIPLLLEPQSLSSIFTHPVYAQLAEGNSDFFIYRMDGP